MPVGVDKVCVDDIEDNDFMAQQWQRPESTFDMLVLNVDGISRDVFLCLMIINNSFDFIKQ